MFVLVLTFAAALLALWLDCRFPRIGPRTVTGGILSIVLTGVALQLTLPLASLLISQRSTVVPLIGVVGVTLPALALAFWSAIWLIKAAVATLGGTVR